MRGRHRCPPLILSFVSGRLIPFCLLLSVLNLLDSARLFQAEEIILQLPAVPTPLGRVLEAVEKQTGQSFIPLAGVGDLIVQLPTDRMPLSRFFTHLRRVLRVRILLSGRTHYVLPVPSPRELLDRLSRHTPAFPPNFQGNLTTVFLTSWGWQEEPFSVSFQAPDRLVIKGRDSVLWTEGDSGKVLRLRPPVMETTHSPLMDWTDPTLGVQGVPALGFGWKKLKGWEPTDSGAVLVAGKPAWVLDLSRSGDPHQEIVYTFSKVSLPGTVLTFYKAPQALPWRVRLYLDVENLSVLRREVMDPGSILLQTVTAAPRNGGPDLTVSESEVRDVVGTVIGRIRWSDLSPSQTAASPPELPPSALADDDPAWDAVRSAQRAWRDRDDIRRAQALLERAIALSSHPVIRYQAAGLFDQMSQRERAWQLLTQTGEEIFDHPGSIPLATSLALALGKEKELIGLLEDRFPSDPAGIGPALAELTGLVQWKSGQFPSLSAHWHRKTVEALSAKDPRTLEDESIAFQSAQRLTVIEWSRDAFPALRQWVDGTASLMEPIRYALLTWIALDEGREAEAKRYWQILQNRFSDRLVLRLFVAELAEAYGLEREAEKEYQTIADQLPLSEEGKRARWHYLRRLIEDGRAEASVRYFLDSLRTLRSDLTRSSFAGEFRTLATLSLRHNLIARTANGFIRRKVFHPYSLWLFDLMAHFSVSEGQRKEALGILSALSDRDAFWAFRWSQEALEGAELIRLDERVSDWWRRFPKQPFFTMLFPQLPILRLPQEKHPAVLRQLVRDASLRSKEIKKSGALSPLEEQIVDALTLLNNPANWLDRPGEVKAHWEKLANWPGEEAASVRTLARQVLVAFHGFHMDAPRFLNLVDSAMETCRDETSRIVIAQNALQVLVRRGQWAPLWTRLSDWLSRPYSDFFKRSLLTAWRWVVGPFAADATAQQSFLKTLETLPDTVPYLVVKAEGYEALKGTESARKTYEKASTMNPPDWFWSVLGEAHLRAKRAERAEEAFLESLTARPDMERAAFWIQSVLDQEKRPDPFLVRRLMAQLGMHWNLLVALAPSEEPKRAFTLMRMAERFATFDPTVSPQRLFSLRLQTAQTAARAGRRDDARKILSLFLQEEVPEAFRSQALDLLRSFAL